MSWKTVLFAGSAGLAIVASALVAPQIVDSIQQQKELTHNSYIASPAIPVSNNATTEALGYASIESLMAQIITLIELDNATGISSPELDTARTELTNTITQYRTMFAINKILFGQELPINMATQTQFDTYLKTINDKLIGLQKTYDTALRHTQTVAEIERVAANSETSSARYPEGAEGVKAKFARLASQLGITVPIYLSEGCGDAPLQEGYQYIACYHVGKGYITVTDAGYRQSEAQLICSLKHENRHRQQEEQGLIQYDANGNVSNRDWLEADAESVCA